MNGLIRETNENLKTIINTMKENLDSAIEALENIQIQMDKKVEEAKKYKIQVDNAKEEIRNIENENKNLELSLNEINEKYSKLNLVSLIEAGNKEIKAKISDNNKEINKNKEQIAELTNKARTIKDLLMNMKKDKTIKEEKLDSLKTIYEFYNKNLSELINFAYEHSDSLETFSYTNESLNDKLLSEEETNPELDNTMVFDEIADIDENRNFKNEITFINNEIENNITNSDYNEYINSMNDNTELTSDEEIEEEPYIDLNSLETTKVFDSIMDSEIELEDSDKEQEETIEETSNDSMFDIDSNFEPTSHIESDIQLEDLVDMEDLSHDDEFNIDFSLEQPMTIETNIESNDLIENNDNKYELNPELTFDKTDITEKNNEDVDNNDNQINISLENNMYNPNFETNNNTQFDLTTNNRINELSELLMDLDNSKTSNIDSTNIEEKIDNIVNFNVKDATMVDIFGNPIKSDDINSTVLETKKIEELFVENGINFNKFKEEEQNYLKQIYDENKFVGIFNILNKHKINVDNLYHSFNIFGEIDFIELDNIINKLVNIGQSVESIGIILEKMPKIKKYNLDEAIASFNDEIKNVNITELIMRAKELYDGGNK